MNKVRLKTPWHNLVPPLSTSEFDALKADINARGVQVPIDIDEDGNILDGHHRYNCDKNAPTRVVSGLSVTEKEAYVIRASGLHRNLSHDQQQQLDKARKVLALKLKQEGQTQKQIAITIGKSQPTVSDWLNTSIIRADNASKVDCRVKVSKAAKDEIANRVLGGHEQKQVAADYKISQQRVSQIVKAADKIHSREDDKSRKTAHLKESLFEVRKGDFREVLSDVTGVTLILTDPPYPKESLPLWSDLGEWAANALADDGMLVAYSGQLYLPEVLANLSEHLDYWWCGAVVHGGTGNLTPLSFPVRKVINQWKPIVMFFKRGGCGYQSTFKDLVIGIGPEKEQHNWQQPVAEAAELIKRFTKEGDLVVDPFAGSGGFCKAASDLGRKAIGAEIL